MAANKKLRILCLHGMVQNAIIFRKKTAVLRKKLDTIADLVYISAPHLSIDPRYTSETMLEAAKDNDGPEELKPFGWWQPMSNESNLTPEGFYVGFKESIAYIQKILIDQGPFDGILGFSQGACMAAVITALLENRTSVPELIPNDFEHPPFRFSIIAAGFKPNTQKATLAAFTQNIKTPSLHMIGEQDTLIVPDRMRELAHAFEDSELLVHAGGHVVPSNAPSRNQTLAFVSKFSGH